jgi:hypothetical protein
MTRWAHSGALYFTVSQLTGQGLTPVSPMGPWVAGLYNQSHFWLGLRALITSIRFDGGPHVFCVTKLGPCAPLALLGLLGLRAIYLYFVFNVFELFPLRGRGGGGWVLVPVVVIGIRQTSVDWSQQRTVAML